MEDGALTDNRRTLTTERLDLRPFYMEDAAFVYNICCEKEIAKFARSIPHPYLLTHAENWIQQHVGFWAEGKAAVFAICLKETGKLLGAVGLEINSEDENAELGYWIDKKRWGQGFCTEAAAEAMRFGFEELSLNRIFAHYMTINPASGRVMEKIGMKPEGLLPKHVRKWGEFFDIALYGLVKSDYEKLKAADQIQHSARIETV